MASLRHKIPHVVQYRQGYRYRRVVPDDVRQSVGKNNWTHTFSAGTSLATIERTAMRMAAEHDRQIAIARGHDLSPEDIAESEKRARKWLEGDKEELHEFLAFIAQSVNDYGIDSIPPKLATTVNAIEHGGQYIPECPTITEALERDTRLYGQGRDPKPLQYAVDSFVQVIGDKEITDIGRAEVAEWLAAMAKLGHAPATLKRRLGALRAITNRVFLDLDHNARNPFERHKIKGGAGGTGDRLPFNKAMLEKIDTYLSESKRLGHETRNILRMMRNTGCGPAEIGGLVVADVSLDSEVPYVWIRQNYQRGIKVEARDRQVPLLGDALDAAKDALKRTKVLTKGSRKNADTTPLFGSFGINGRAADSISAKINRAIRTAEIPKSPRLTAYSFRHTIKEAMRAAGVSDHIQRRLLGHSGEGVADRYGSPRGRLNETRDALTAALEHLGDVDPSIYSEKERMK